jgi:hypothetical protein
MRSKVVLTILTGTGILVMCLALIELALRLFSPMYLTGGYIGDYIYDEGLGYRLKQGRFVQMTDYRQEAYVNALGTVNFQRDFEGYQKLVFASGDSYTQGTGLPPDMSYPAQLDFELNVGSNGYEKRFGIVNLGLAAFGGEQSLIAIIRYIELIGIPGYILYLGCSNDEEDDQMFRSGYKHRAMVDGNPRYGAFVGLLQALTHRTEIGKRLNYIRGRLARKEESAAGGDNRAPGRPVAEMQEQVLLRLKAIADEHGSVLVVGWANDPENTYDPASYKWLKQWAERQNVLFADWYPTVASVKRSIPDLPQSNDHSGGHYRGWVNRLIARTFAETIRSVELHSLEQPPKKAQ